MVITLSGAGNKVHCCLFCSKMYARISKHYMQVDKQEPEVVNILILPKEIKTMKNHVGKAGKQGRFSPQL